MRTGIHPIVPIRRFLIRCCAPTMIMLVLLWAQSARAQIPPRPQPPIDPKLPTFWMIGDSTVLNGRDTGSNGQWGLGNPMHLFFDEKKMNVQNHGVGATNTRTYMNDENDWAAILDQIKPGDYLFVLFGHNNDGAAPIGGTVDQRNTIAGNGEETANYNNPHTGQVEIVHTYGWYLRKYVTDAQAKGAALTILCSPMPRNRWTGGELNPNADFVEWTKEAASQSGASFVDLDGIMRAKYAVWGEKKVTDELFPEGEYLHSDWAGAVADAQGVIEGLKALQPHCPLVDYLLAVPPTELKNPSGRAR